MFGINEYNNRMKITNGDTAHIELVVPSYTLQRGDTVYMTVKPIDEDGYLFQKRITSFEDGRAVIKLEPRDTKGAIGKYYYDIQVTRANGDVHTVVPTTIFEVIGGITNE